MWMALGFVTALAIPVQAAVTFPDPVLEAHIREKIEKPIGPINGS
jgi:hypothetical protein